MNKNIRFRRAAHASRPVLVLFMLFFAFLSLSAQVIRVTGKVISKEKGTPLLGVNVVDAKEDRLLATTDADGRFAVNTYENGTLRFTIMGAKPLTMRIKGRKNLDIELEEKSIDLGEATVKAERITDEIMVEPTVIEIVGNWAIIPIRVRIPNRMMSRDTRLVLQPVVDNATTKQLLLGTPMVYDAREYHWTQDRMYDFDMEGQDPLAKYVTVKSRETKEEGKRNDIIGRNDSIYLEDPRQQFRCDTYVAIEDYRRIVYRDTTTIAQGTIYPLRFLDYSFGASEITDTAYYPKAELQLRDSKGDIKLQFPIGKYALDLSNPQNQQELSALNAQLKSIETSKESTLRAFSITGTASPDGRYASNLNLAERRMRSALNYIVGQLSSSTRRNLEVSSHAAVAPWSDVVALMRRDSLDEQADQIEEITERYKNKDEQSKRIRRLPFYSSLLEGKYLPSLRRVQYEMNYSIYRFLTLDEIRALHDKDYRQLSRYEFFRLYRGENDKARREEYIRQALEIYPSFMVAANDLQALLIERNEPDAKLLEPFAGKDAPATLNVNHTIALLDAGRFAAADTVAQFIPSTEETRLLKAVTGALNGEYKENFQTIASTGLRNEVLMLLAMKDNEKALTRAQELPKDEAISHYILAICYNRTNHPSEAFDALKRSFQLDPSLKEIAPLDGDVNSLLLDK